MQVSAWMIRMEADFTTVRKIGCMSDGGREFLSELNS